jgi:ATP-binding cassette subfamily B protein
MKIKAFGILRRLLVYFRPHSSSLFVVAFLLIISTISLVGRPIILRWIIDSAITTGNRQELLHYSGYFIILLISGVISGYYQLIIASNMGITIVNDLKKQLFDHILNLDLAFFDKNQTGWLISRVESDTEQLKGFCSHITIRIFTNVLMFAGILYVLFSTDATIASAMSVVLLVLLVTVFVFLGKVRHLYDDVRARYAELSGFITEYVQGIPIIRHYNRIDAIRDELTAKNDERYHSETKAALYEYGFWAVILFFIETVLIAVTLWIGIGKVFAGTMSIGTLVMFIEFSRQITWPIIMFSEFFNSIQRSFVAAERVFYILDTKSQIVLSENPYLEEIDHQEIIFKDVNFSYKPDQPVLKNINFTIKKGEKIALVGPSGSGKTTTASLLCRFMDPISGEILINNRNLKEYSLQNWREKLGLVLQDIYLFPGTILDNLRVLDDSISEETVREAAQKMGISEFVTRLPDDFHTELSERGTNLSLGERQLLSFTRALTFQPDLLILDEATSSIDPQTEAILQRGIEELTANRTAVIIAHRLSTIRHVDRILVFKDGEIVETGTHQQLLDKQGLYHHLYSLQSTKMEGKS